MLIACERVGYRQQGVDILSDINWRIDRGQHWAVLGPEWLRQDDAAANRVRLSLADERPRAAAGRRADRSGRAAAEHRLDFVGHDCRDSADGHRSGNGRHRPARAVRAQAVAGIRADAMPISPTPRPSLTRLGCQTLADKPFGVLSQGERQQVLIARARMARPLLLGARRAVRRHGPRRARAVLLATWLRRSRMTNDEATPNRIARPSYLVTHHIEEIVPGIQNTLILSAAASIRPVRRAKSSRAKRLKRSTARGSPASNRAAAGCGRCGAE